MTVAILGFTHTVGEFGGVLMIGGNIPGETQVRSLIIDNHGEALDHDAAQRLAASTSATRPMRWRDWPTASSR